MIKNCQVSLTSRDFCTCRTAWCTYYIQQFVIYNLTRTNCKTFTQGAEKGRRKGKRRMQKILHVYMIWGLYRYLFISNINKGNLINKLKKKGFLTGVRKTVKISIPLKKKIIAQIKEKYLLHIFFHLKKFEPRRYKKQ